MRYWQRRRLGGLRRQQDKQRTADRHADFERLDARMLLAGDLVANWRAEDLVANLDDGANVSAWVDSVSGIVAQAEGMPKLQASGVGGRAVISFDPSDGNDRFLVSQLSNPLSGADDFSVVVAFRTDSNNLAGGTGAWGEATGLVDANQLGFGKDWGVVINSAGQVGAGMTGGFGTTATSAYSAISGLNDNQYHIAAVTRAGSNLTIYVDGQVQGSLTDADGTSRSPSGISIGAQLTSTGFYPGDLLDIRLYNGALDAGEVTTITDQIDSFYNNQAPQAMDDSYTLQEDLTLFFAPAATGLLSNDIDADGDSMTVELVSGPQHGDLTLNADGSFIYDSNPNFFGTDSFTYRAVDFRPGEVATVTLNVTPVYDGVSPQPDIYRARPGNPLVIPSLVGVLWNDANPDEANLTVMLEDNVAGGDLSLQADGSFTYDPQGFTGRTSFTYRVDDGTKVTAPVQVTLAVTTPPTAVADQFEVDEDQQLVISDAAQGLLANDVDPESDPLTVTLVDTTTQGELVVQEDGTFVYTPAQDYNGTDEFTYFVNDGFDNSATVTVTITVNSVNDYPTAAEDGYFVQPNRTLARTAAQGVLANDFDLENPDMQALLVDAPQFGTIDLFPNGGFVYVPHAGFSGDDFFTYQASDGIDLAPPTRVSIGVLAEPLVINEFLASNVDNLDTRVKAAVEDRFRGLREYPDWIEVKNVLSHPIDLGGLHLTDDKDNLTKWAFPVGTVLEPNGLLTVFASGLDITNPELDQNGFMHTNFSLSDSGEFLALTDVDGTVLHSYGTGYPRQLPDTSYGLSDTGARYFLAPTPGEENSGESRAGIAEGPTIDQDHGFFTSAIQVTISNQDPSTSVHYTIDGSTPTLQSPAYSGPIEITGTTVVRAAAFKDDYLPSRVDTRSYLYIEDILQQSLNGRAPAGWPTSWGSNVVDYGMDPDIVNDDVWGPQMTEALTQIPSMSIVTDLDNLFNSTTGIYARPGNDGPSWERAASLELINPDGSIGFQHNIGLRIRGGFSRSTSNPKHAFRVFFDSPHSSDGWLNFPLFEDEGTDQFAKVDLRTTQNYSWSFQNDGRNTFLRDIYSRDLQGAMGNQYTRGRFYHLYINGQYFGLYQTDERPEANFASTYYGGSPDDYDVIHNDPRQNGATNGNTEAYQRLHAYFAQDGGLSDANMASYYQAQGMNPDGTRNPEFERLLDVDNLIDYMIITYYTSDADGPGSKFTRPGLNNYFTIFNREDPDGFKFFEHDSEHSMDTGNAAGANYNMVTPFVNNGRTFPNFNPHYMHEQLANSNSDYLIRFQDRVAELFADGGLLSDETVIAMLESRASEIDMAIIAESARWGDAKRSRPYTKNDWERAVQTLERWVTSRARGAGRRQEVLEQFDRVDWWNFNINRPTFSDAGGRVDPGHVVTLSVEGLGSILVTTDGSDPRLSGGEASESAIVLTSGQTLTIETGGIVRARTLNGKDWSPLSEVQYFVEDPATLATLRVSELHYHPADPTAAERAAGFDDGDDFEFIELVNIGTKAIDLSGVEFAQVSVNGDLEGVVFVFAEGTKLAPREHIVVAENVAAFQARYGSEIRVAGQWTGGLGNGGETILLRTLDGGEHRITYSDDWYTSTDGNGPSLEVINVRNADLATWSTAAAWRPSLTSGGTPGTSSDTPLPGDVNGDGVFSSRDLVLVFQAGEYEDGINGNSTFEEGDWNGDGDFTTSDLVYVFSRVGYQVLPSQPARRTLQTQSHDAIFADWDAETKPTTLSTAEAAALEAVWSDAERTDRRKLLLDAD